MLDTITNVAEVDKLRRRRRAGRTSPARGSLTGPGGRRRSPPTDLLAKQLVGTEIVNATNSNTEAVIGEFVTYRVTHHRARGDDARRRPDRHARPGTGVRRPRLGRPVERRDASRAARRPSVTNNGRNLQFNLGNITNSNTNNAVPETITLTYRAVVVNTAASQAQRPGQQLGPVHVHRPGNAEDRGGRERHDHRAAGEDRQVGVGGRRRQHRRRGRPVRLHHRAEQPARRRTSSPPTPST